MATHKPLNEQVIFITGASSGIGLRTAEKAAENGARVVLVARNEEALSRAVAGIREAGGQAIYAVADVAEADQIRAAADNAVQTFGPIDTWVNNAGVSLFTRITENNIEDDRRLFETNFWGIVHGSRLAVEYLKDRGGALINLGSEVSDVAIPVQGMYATSKHAVLGFTDALRMELKEAGTPITVTLIKPAAINTPFAKHAKNTTEHEPTLPDPVYSPDVVADQILHAAVHGGREIYAGGGGRVMASLGQHFPGVMDLLSGLFSSQQTTDRPADHSNEGLHETRGGHAVEGDVDRDRHVMRHSLYGVVRRHPIATVATAAVLGAAAVYLMKKASEVDREEELTFAERARRAAEYAADKATAAAHTYGGRFAEPAEQAINSVREKAREYAGKWLG